METITVTLRGKYIRTPEIRDRNRANAVPSAPCPIGCPCGRHRFHPNSHGKSCLPNCQCGRHVRTVEHNRLIGVGVMKAKRDRQIPALRRPDRQPVLRVAQKPQAQPSLILDGLVPVFSTCRSCGLIMQVTNQRDRSHPTCEPQPTQMEMWEQTWLAIAESAPYGKLQPQLRNKLERLEFKIDVARDEETALHDAAMTYTSYGWPVFPLVQNGKRPAIGKAHGGSGVLDATNDAKRIHRWWERNPNHNVGLATGFLFDVIDVDPDKGGAESIAKLLTTGRVPVVHGIVATAGADKTDKEPARPAGMHLYIKSTGRGNYAGVLPGVDYRGLGGYVVSPPSSLGSRVRSWSWAVEPSPEIKGDK